MNTVFPSSVQRLHQLAWQPGEWMDENWWEALSLQNWQQSYLQYPVLRPALNKLIISRRGFPQQVLPASLTSQQEQLLTLEPHLPRLCTALGLLMFCCPDYLLLGHYRRELASILGAHGCDQLLALGEMQQPQPPELSPQQLPENALAKGVGWLRASSSSCVVCHALQFALPPGPADSIPDAGSCLPWLLRIGRFL